ncbi:helix-turn-helix transcriptional regulator [Halorussus gelatinilyticus]|uniref:Helix-turn-helix transcriptional regulator n=1 Tax=Halorussus gelatinilyticus TaxID=2937524 RepID=A0A8U0IFF1_9EURY|nr:helix-turn-helix domain-containing protein [Halorussus gelatinilyticus]UPV99420.1 helix-turn-helix transcriptional regulator [Halorussus gelatinilyticus]
MTETVEEEACVASWCAGDDWCTVTCTAHLLGKKWHPVILHRLLVHGPLGFNALKDDIESISSTVLSNSLEDLEDKALVNRKIVSEKPVRVQYSLTERGASLEPVIEAMDAWGETHLPETSCS